MFLKTWPRFVACFLLPLLAGAGALQHAVDRTPERVAERETNRIEDMSAVSTAIETTGALLMGGFKSLTVDFLWVRLSDLLQDHQWIEAVQVAEFITRFQPRNEEVWALLVHDLLYDIPANIEDRTEKWAYVRRGLEMGRAGTRRLPRSPYIAYQLGFGLSHRLVQDEYLIGMFEAERGCSPFAEAREWFDVSLRDLREMLRRESYASPTGLNVTPEILSSFIRSASMQEAGWALYRHGDTVTARRALGRALSEVERQLSRSDRAVFTAPMLVRFRACLRELLAAVDVESEVAPLLKAGRKEEARARLLDAWNAYRRAILNPDAPADSRHDLVRETFIEGHWTAIGEPLGGDGWEPNDSGDLWTSIGLAGGPVDLRATIGPMRGDVDRYYFVPPAGGAVRVDLKFPPGKLAPVVTVGEYLPDGYTLRAETRRVLKPDPGAGAVRIDMPAVKPRTEYLLQVGCAPDGPWSTEPYQLRVEFAPEGSAPGGPQGGRKPPGKGK